MDSLERDGFFEGDPPRFEVEPLRKRSPDSSRRRVCDHRLTQAAVAPSLLRSRYGIEWGQVDAVHRITRKQEVMDGDDAIAIEIQGNKISRRLE
jgi:hypothetical protein